VRLIKLEHCVIIAGSVFDSRDAGSVALRLAINAMLLYADRVAQRPHPYAHRVMTEPWSHAKGKQ
jgi:hypothetical protein